MSKIERERVAANVVTYNRKQLLGDCLNALLNQTYLLDAIYIIDNASTDSTPEYLMGKGFIDRSLHPDKEPHEATKVIPLPSFPHKTVEIHYVRMHENTGSSGGQYEGVKRGYAKGFDWLWLMDDDGRPNFNALERLIIKAHPDIGVLHPLVVSPNDENIFSFGCWAIENNRRTLYKTLEEFNKKYKNETTVLSLGCPFNGTLINRNVIKNHGLPIRDLFIRGDETEYLYRLHKGGVITVVVCDAIFYHPFDPYAYNPLETDKKDWWKLYYQFRNEIVVLKLFKKPIFAQLSFIKAKLLNLFYVLFKSKNETKLFKAKIILIATFHGILGRFGKYSI